MTSYLDAVDLLPNLFYQAGLFSAVVATFVTQTSQNLQPDFSEVSASLLTEQVALLRIIAAGGNASTVNASPLTHDSVFRPESRDVWLNSLWIISLSLTLSTALITGLIKQWLNFYIAETAGSPKRIACIRQFRIMGLRAWGVSEIIELLPILMNASLFLFLVGLVLFLRGLSGTRGIEEAVIVLTSTLFAFYVMSGLFPVWNPGCPYKTSLSQMFAFTLKPLKMIAIRLIVFVVHITQLIIHLTFTYIVEALMNDTVQLNYFAANGAWLELSGGPLSIGFYEYSSKDLR